MQGSITITRIADHKLRLQWPAGLVTAPVSLRWGHRPDGDAGDYRPLAVVKEGGEIAVTDPSPGRRSYYALVPAEGQPIIAAERRLPLVGQVNFRDLGGYAAADGRRVRWGRLYRSGDLGHLTDDDLAYLDDLDLKLVCDLRVDFEVKRSPDRLPKGVARLNLPIRGGEMPEAILYESVDNGDLSRLDPDFLIHSYRMFVRDFTPAYAEMLGQVAAGGNQPAVVHCTAGKDRAGLGAAIILWALGVPMETVVDDYLLSNTYRASWTEQTLDRIRQAAVARSGIPAEAIDLVPVEALFAARRTYMNAALESIDAEYGSLARYIRHGLGLSQGAQRALQENLLE
ncbi:MAG: tyrosine-protein phosphatase [Chloroflexota bacterium]|nr:MAG: tyrosine-protein phosphatase [Chloroflexota bacterium]